MLSRWFWSPSGYRLVVQCCPSPSSVPLVGFVSVLSAADILISRKSSVRARFSRVALFWPALRTLLVRP
uniref:Uncharacterized protein n=1 Tax=Caenorhabditis japonica TaxID=281687 RepID=A0A8R1EL25_CAEJA